MRNDLGISCKCWVKRSKVKVRVMIKVNTNHAALKNEWSESVLTWYREWLWDILQAVWFWVERSKVKIRVGVALGLGLRLTLMSEPSLKLGIRNDLRKSFKWHGFGLKGQRSTLGLEFTAIRHGFELYECLLVVVVAIIKEAKRRMWCSLHQRGRRVSTTTKKAAITGSRSSAIRSPTGSLNSLAAARPS